MPTLLDTLRGRDLSFLNMVAGAWGLELNAPDVAAALPRLVAGILSHPWRGDVLSALPGEAQAALEQLLRSDGRVSWAVFTRRFGEVRPFGPGKREKERPDLHPASPAEVLWYRALIGRAIFPGELPPQEYAYIPEDLLEMIVPLGPGEDLAPGCPASPGESAQPLPAGDAVLDHAATLLAALRLGLPPAQAGIPPADIAPDFLLELLNAAQLLDENGVPLAEPTRTFLEAPRGQALAQLAVAWMHAPQLNELRLLPGLRCEGDWQNDPLAARQAALNWLAQLPNQVGWWSLAAFIKAIREHDPDFQRPAGDYDSWFIRSTASGEYLRGFGAWDAVDGALLRYLLCGPLHWLGILDLAAPRPGEAPSAFRLSAWASDLLSGRSPQGLARETEKIKLTSAGKISVPHLAPRTLRYQIARFCLWEGAMGEEYQYRIAPAGLERAASQGLRPRQLLALLRRHVESGAFPPSLAAALERWEAGGSQATIEAAVLLRAASPQVVEALKKTRAVRFILEEISPTLLLLRPGAEEKVLEALNESGYLGDVRRGP